MENPVKGNSVKGHPRENPIKGAPRNPVKGHPSE